MSQENREVSYASNAPIYAGPHDDAQTSVPYTKYKVAGTPKGQWDESAWKLSASCTDDAELHIQYKKLDTDNGVGLRHVVIKPFFELIYM